MKSLGKTKKKIRIWCPGGDENLGYTEESGQDVDKIKVKYVRCKICDQRFEAYNKRSGCCSITCVPKHKAY